jgi:poly(3-hydroxybutyrate) depolymerase
MDGARMRRLTGHAFDAIADREGVLVVYPEGYGGSWNDCRSVGEFESRRLGIDDVAFARALIGWFARDYGIDERAFAAGLSMVGSCTARAGRRTWPGHCGRRWPAGARHRPCGVWPSGRHDIIAGTADPL